MPCLPSAANCTSFQRAQFNSVNSVKKFIKLQNVIMMTAVLEFTLI